MADGDLLSLLLKVEGGEASAAEIGQVKAALRSVEVQNDALKSRFQEGFQHIALRGFIAQSARAAGVGGELRPILHLIQTGLTGISEAAGLAGSTTLLLGTAFTALAAIGFVVYEHFKKHSESLEQLAQKQTTALETTDSLRIALNEYAAEVDGLPAKLNTLKDAVDRLSSSQVEAARHTEMDQLSKVRAEIDSRKEKIYTLEQENISLQATIAYSERHGLATAGLTAHILKNKDAIEKLDQANRDSIDANIILTDKIISQGEGYKNSEEKAKKLTEAHKKEAEEADKIAKKKEAQDEKDEKRREENVIKEVKAYEEIEAGRKSLEEQIKLLADTEAESIGNAQERKSASIQKFRDEQAKKIEETYQKAIKDAEENEASIVNIEKQKNLALEQLAKTVEAKQRDNYSSAQLYAITIGKSIETSFADAAAKAILSHKSMKDSLIAISEQVKQALIADTIKWSIEQFIAAGKASYAHATVATAAKASSLAQVTATAEATVAINAQIVAVNALTVSLAAATAQALELDTALAAAAFL